MMNRAIGRRPFHVWKILLASLLLSACASTPIETDQQPASVTPAQVVADSSAADAVAEGSTVLWGGTIISSNNLEDATRLEVLAYPLNSGQRPQSSKPAEGRFLIIADGYLETVDFAAGRQVTVLGALTSNTSGLVGESRYDYPTVLSEQLHLWKPAGEKSRTGFSFGLGISL